MIHRKCYDEMLENFYMQLRAYGSISSSWRPGIFTCSDSSCLSCLSHLPLVSVVCDLSWVWLTHWMHLISSPTCCHHAHQLLFKHLDLPHYYRQLVQNFGLSLVTRFCVIFIFSFCLLVTCSILLPRSHPFSESSSAGSPQNQLICSTFTCKPICKITTHHLLFPV